MPDKKDPKYVEQLEQSLLILHQKQDYQQKLIDNPLHPQRNILMNRIEELQNEVEKVVSEME